MHKRYFFIVLLLLCQRVNAQSPNWQWVKGLVSDGSVNAKVVCTDANQNVYVAGDFTGPPLKIDNISIPGGRTFLIKCDPTGKIIWTKLSNEVGFIKSMCVDNEGNLLVAGFFRGYSLVLDNNNIVLVNKGDNDVFMAKFNPNGNVLWAKSYGGAYADIGTSITTDVLNNVILAGSFESDSIKFDHITLVNKMEFDEDVFIVKCNASGNVIWAQSGNGLDQDIPEALTTDLNGNIALAGYFKSQSFSFGNTTFVNTDTTFLSYDGFLLKLSTAGDVLWSAKIAGNYDDKPRSIKYDANGNLIVAGNFNSTNVSLGDTVLTNKGAVKTNDMFLVKYDSTGKKIWVLGIGTPKSEEIEGLAVDKNGNIYETGTFRSNQITFDKNITLTNSGNNVNYPTDFYLVQFNPDGKAIWAKNATNAGDFSYGYGIDVTKSGTIYNTGFYKTRITLDNILSPNAGKDGAGFIAKLCAFSGVISITGSTAICAGGSTTLDAGAGYPKYVWSNKDTTQQITVSAAGTYSVIVTNDVGCEAAASIVVTMITKPEMTASYEVLPACNRTLTPSIKFSSVPKGATITWTNSNSSIGLPSNGTGDIPSFIAIDTSIVPIQAKIMATATLAGSGCVFPKDSININVSPRVDASFYYTDSVFCQADANPIPIVTGKKGYFSTSDPGVTVNYLTGEIDLLASSPGKYKIMHFSNAVCRDTSYFSMTIKGIAKIDAGWDVNLCGGDTLQLLSSKGGLTQTVLWKTSGTGKFNDSTALRPKYVPSLADIDLGKVMLTVSTDKPAMGCGEAAHDTLFVTILKCKYPTVETTFFKSCNLDGMKNTLSSVIQTADSNYVFSGYVPIYKDKIYNYCLLKTNKYGDTIWSRIFTNKNLSASNLRKTIVRQTTDGGYIAAFTVSQMNKYNNIILMKTDNNGKMLWSKRYIGDLNDAVNSIIVTKDGGYAVVGQTWEVSGMKLGCIFLLKTDGLGNVEWSKTYRQGYSTEANDVVQTLDGGYVIAGSLSVGGKAPAVYLAKVDSTGEPLWEKSYRKDTDTIVWVKKVLATKDGGYMVFGHRAMSKSETTYCQLIKTNADGDIQWARLYGGYLGSYKGTSITETYDGCYAFSGYIFGRNICNSYLVKISSQGIKAFEKIYGDSVSSNSSSADYGSLLQAMDGGYMMCSSLNGFFNESLLIKTDEQGTTCFVRNGTGELYSRELTVTPLTSIISSKGYSENIVFDSYSWINPSTRCISSAPVRPGDSDANTVADNFDILPIGLYYNNNGVPRSSTSNLWQEYPAKDWGAMQTNGHDIKHADCNGDGIVNSDDTTAIQLNFNLKHATPHYYNYTKQVGAPDLYFVTKKNTYKSTDSVEVEVWLGNSTLPISNLYGLAFNIDYNSDLVQAATEQLTYPNSWVGKNQQDVLNILKVDRSLNVCYYGQTRFNHQNAKGYGKIATFNFQLKDNIPDNTKMIFAVSSYQANDSVGTPLVFNLMKDTIIINPSTIGINEENSDLRMTISPNPFITKAQISFNKELRNSTVEIFDVLGQKVRTISFSGNELSLEREGLKPGIYFIQIVSANMILTNKKVVIQ
jgi:hypothetical protein